MLENYYVATCYKNIASPNILFFLIDLNTKSYKYDVIVNTGLMLLV